MTAGGAVAVLGFAAAGGDTGGVFAAGARVSPGKGETTGGVGAVDAGSPGGAVLAVLAAGGAFPEGGAGVEGAFVTAGAVLSAVCAATVAWAPLASVPLPLSGADELPLRLLGAAPALAGGFGVEAFSLAGVLDFLVMVILLSWR